MKRTRPQEPMHVRLALLAAGLSAAAVLVVVVATVVVLLLRPAVAQGSHAEPADAASSMARQLQLPAAAGSCRSAHAPYENYAMCSHHHGAANLQPRVPSRAMSGAGSADC
jgi:hypothetical protein